MSGPTQYEMDRHRIKGGEDHPPPRLDAAHRESVRVDVDGGEELIKRALHGTALPHGCHCEHHALSCEAFTVIDVGERYAS
jgi:hypothetical protein